MPPDEKALTEAIDAAIVDATPQPLETETPANEEEESHETEADAAAGGGEAAGEGAHDSPGEGSGDAREAEAGGDGAEGNAGGEGDDATQGERADAAAADADGKGKPNGAAKDEKDKPAKSAKPKPDADAEAAAGGEKAKPKPKEPDHINDPIPGNLAVKTRERMTSLVTTAKTLTKERDEAREQTETFLAAIAETGADPETFARHVEVLRLINSKEPDEQRKALKALRTVANKLATELGEREPGKELEGHADLEEAVEDGDLSRDHAVEIAQARNRKKAEETRAERDKAASDEQAKHEAAVAAARVELNELELAMRSADPLYDRKRAAVENAAKALLPTIPPSQWARAYKRLLDSVDTTRLPAAKPRVGDGGTQERVPRGTGSAQPMRPRQGAGGGARPEPKSLAEAIDFGLEQARR